MKHATLLFTLTALMGYTCVTSKAQVNNQWTHGDYSVYAIVKQDGKTEIDRLHAGGGVFSDPSESNNNGESDCDVIFSVTWSTTGTTDINVWPDLILTGYAPEASDHASSDGQSDFFFYGKATDPIHWSYNVSWEPPADEFSLTLHASLSPETLMIEGDSQALEKDDLGATAYALVGYTTTPAGN